MQAPSHTSAVDGQPQLPVVQVSAPGHACPHVPQSSVLVARFTHASAHATRGDTQAQEPPMHDSPAGHVWPHPPQFFSFVCGSTHAPSHTRSLAGHATQAPFVHTSDASHWCPQMPQSLRLVSIDVQSVPQNTRGAVHAHSPATHDSFAGQAFPQTPQFLMFVWGSTHTPVQSRFDAGQAAQSPLAHTSDGRHGSPHAPQLSWFT
jgi:hypothetical protein